MLLLLSVCCCCRHRRQQHAHFSLLSAPLFLSECSLTGDEQLKRVVDNKFQTTINYCYKYFAKGFCARSSSATSSSAWAKFEGVCRQTTDSIFFRFLLFFFCFFWGQVTGQSDRDSFEIELAIESEMGREKCRERRRTVAVWETINRSDL